MRLFGKKELSIGKFRIPFLGFLSGGTAGGVIGSSMGIAMLGTAFPGTWILAIAGALTFSLGEVFINARRSRDEVIRKLVRTVYILGFLLLVCVVLNAILCIIVFAGRD